MLKVLAIQKKVIIFWVLQNENINIYVKTCEKNCLILLNNTSKTCSFELKISRNIEIHYALHLKYIFIHVTHFTEVALLP